MTKDTSGNINDYLKTIGKNRQVFDFEKIDAEGFSINIMFSERGQKGKTYSYKDFILKKFREKGIGGYFMKNTEKLIEKELPKTLKNHMLQEPDKWKNVSRVGKHLILDENGEKNSFLEFIALSTSEQEKGSRDASKQYVFLDEFNVGDSHIRAHQTFLLDNWYATMTSEYGEDVKNPIKSFIAGNFKSLASTLIADMGIYTIEHEVTKIYTECGIPLILILVPVSEDSEVKKKNSKNWVYHLSKITGNADHMFGNKNKYDTMNGIIKDMDTKLHSCIHMATYKIDGRFIDLWNKPSQPNKGIWFTKHVPDNIMKQFNKSRSKSNTIAGTKKDMDGEYALLTTAGKILIHEMNKKGKVKFDSMLTKKLVFSCL